MSLVTMFFAVPPTAVAPSWMPFQENSLNDLSSSWPMSVTIPIFKATGVGVGAAVALAAELALGLGLGAAALLQPATTSPKTRPSARRRFMCSLDLPSIIARLRDAGILGQARTLHRT